MRYQWSLKGRMRSQWSLKGPEHRAISILIYYMLIYWYYKNSRVSGARLTSSTGRTLRTPGVGSSATIGRLFEVHVPICSKISMNIIGYVYTYLVWMLLFIMSCPIKWAMFINKATTAPCWTTIPLTPLEPVVVWWGVWLCVQFLFI